jgi:hypothetical protein
LKRHATHLVPAKWRDPYDRVSDIAFTDGLDRDRGVGRILMSAEIIRFNLRFNRRRAPLCLPAIAFRSAAEADDLSMDHVDTAPCDHVWPDQTAPATTET